MARAGSAKTLERLSETQRPDGSLELTVRVWTSKGKRRQGQKIVSNPVDRKFVFRPEAYAMYIRMHDGIRNVLGSLSAHTNESPLPRSAPGIGLFAWIYLKGSKESSIPDETVIDEAMMRELFRKARMRIP